MTSDLDRPFSIDTKPLSVLIGVHEGTAFTTDLKIFERDGWLHVSEKNYASGILVQDDTWSHFEWKAIPTIMPVVAAWCKMRASWLRAAFNKHDGRTFDQQGAILVSSMLTSPHELSEMGSGIHDGQQRVVTLYAHKSRKGFRLR